MLLKKIFIILISGLSLFNLSCKRSTLFTEMSPGETNISFTNEITEDGFNNIMTYEYTYNGGGVAAGDLNNDGFTDIYLVGNSVSNKLFLNQGQWQFKDVSKEAGIEGRMDWATGVTLIDINGDGWLDIYISYSGNAPEEGYKKSIIQDYVPRANQLFINNGVENGAVPTFTESATEYGLDAAGNFSTQAYFFDYDLDGDLDLFLLNHANMFYSAFFNVQNLRSSRHPYFGNKLFRNDNGKFTEVSEMSGIHGSGLNFGLSAAVTDINKDGWPDIYVTNDYEEQDFFYINNQDGTFKDISHLAIGHMSKYAMGSDIADINNDSHPEVFVLDMLPEDNYRQKILKGSDEYDKFTRAADSGYHNQYMKNTLQLNRGLATDTLPRFSEIAQFSGIANTDWSWAALLADFDNDGFKDLFVTNGYLRDVTNMDFVNSEANKEISKSHASNKPVDLMPFIKKMPSTKIPNYSFRNSNGLKFNNTTKEWGLDKNSVSNAAVYADLDNDGDLDLVVNNLNEPVSVYKNNQETLNKNNFIKIKLEGQGKNSFGLGAKIFINLEDDQQLYHEAYYTRGYLSSVEPLLTIGIGEAKRIKKVRVEWPDERISELKDVKANQTLEVDQAKAVKEEKDVKLMKPLLVDVTSESGLDFEHVENNYVDFLHHRLVPYQMSKLGGTLAVGDVNGDGNDDVFFGGASGQAGQLFFGNDDGTLFKSLEQQPWESYKDLKKEDIAISFFDADGDNDLDIYVVSGGNEQPEGASYYQDRLYINNGEGTFEKAEGSLPNTSFSGGVVVPGDYDNDGDLDLFVGGRHTAHNYPFTPKSLLLRNDTQNGMVKFTNAREDEIERMGMVTDAVWMDIDDDSWLDLILVGEWMPVTLLKNDQGNLRNITKDMGLENTSGWWSTIEAEDFDGDGDTDFLLGNAGINTQFQASVDEPMTYYVQDINKDGDLDPILSYYIQGESYPLPSRDDLLGQVNSLRKEYTTYESYAEATMKDLFRAGNVSSSAILEIHDLRSSYLENKEGEFILEPLPAMAQFSMVNGFVQGDFTGDGSGNILAAGNFHPYRVSLGKSDASMGFLLNMENNKWIPHDKNSPLGLTGDIRDIQVMQFKHGVKRIVVSRNNAPAGLYKPIAGE